MHATGIRLTQGSARVASTGVKRRSYDVARSGARLLPNLAPVRVRRGRGCTGSPRPARAALARNGIPASPSGGGETDGSSLFGFALRAAQPLDRRHSDDPTLTVQLKRPTRALAAPLRPDGGNAQRPGEPKFDQLGGEPKLVLDWTYPLTGVACVSRIYTHHAALSMAGNGVFVNETFGTTLSELRNA
jgi:hypothetical protein